MHSALKFFRDITLNRKHRLKHSNSTAFPYKLFKICTQVISKITDSYSDDEQNSHNNHSLDDVYSLKYKSLKECLWIFGHFFSCKNINFAILQVYNEPLVDVIPILIKQIVSIPQEHTMTFTELQHATQFFLCGVLVCAPFIITEFDSKDIQSVFEIMYSFLRGCRKQKNSVVGNMIIQEQSMLTRPLLDSIGGIARYWEDIAFNPVHKLYN
eukprot:UN30009